MHTQGDPLYMVIYGLTLVPLSKFLREQTPAVTQPFYADDLSFSGYASDIAQAMMLLQHHGPSRGYFPEPTKSSRVVVCSEYEEIQATLLLLLMLVFLRVAVFVRVTCCICACYGLYFCVLRVFLYIWVLHAVFCIFGCYMLYFRVLGLGLG